MKEQKKERKHVGELIGELSAGCAFSKRAIAKMHCMMMISNPCAAASYHFYSKKFQSQVIAMPDTNNTFQFRKFSNETRVRSAIAFQNSPTKVTDCNQRVNGRLNLAKNTTRYRNGRR